jgi:hypothetical protein
MERSREMAVGWMGILGIWWRFEGSLMEFLEICQDLGVLSRILENFKRIWEFS